MRFAEIGVERVPAVARNGTWIPGVDTARVAEFLGLAVETRAVLPARILIARLGHVLATATRLASQIPASCLANKLPNRDRTLLALVNHIVEIAAGYLVVESGGAFDASVAGAIPARELDRDDLAARAHSVCASLSALPPTPRRRVATYYGSADLHRVLERCTWHAAQHTRQLAFMLGRLGIEPDQPLTRTDLDGLPVPRAVWDG